MYGCSNLLFLYLVSLFNTKLGSSVTSFKMLLTIEYHKKYFVQTSDKLSEFFFISITNLTLYSSGIFEFCFRFMKNCKSFSSIFLSFDSEDSLSLIVLYLLHSSIFQSLLFLKEEKVYHFDEY